jgi:thiol-disulfide isomerase/thioredoxin
MFGSAAVVTTLVTIGVVWLAGGDSPGSGAASVGMDPALEVPFARFDGGAETLDSYVGTPLVVNFFASWCTPCIAELPRFEEVHQELGDQVKFVGLNLQDAPDAGLAVIARTGISYDVGRDPELRRVRDADNGVHRCPRSGGRGLEWRTVGG